MRSPADEASTASTFTVALARLVLRDLGQAYRALRHRREVARLGDLDDRALKDIGLTRSDVRAALAMPFGCDPSDHLASVAGHKRAAAPERSGLEASAARLRRDDAPVTAAVAPRLAA